MTTAAFPRLEAAYAAANVSGYIYEHLLSQQALLAQTKKMSETNSGTVYRPVETAKLAPDTRNLPASTVVAFPTAFWQGATARASAQRTVSAVGLALAADALGMTGPKGLQQWGNHPLAVVMRAALPLRVAAWPGVLWNQNVFQRLGWGVGPLQGTTIGSGLAEYVLGTGFHDKPVALAVSPGYMVGAPPDFDEFKAYGFLGIPERLLWHASQRLLRPSADAKPTRGANGATTAASVHPARKALAGACLLGAVLLRVGSQAFRLPLCAVWCCELLLGGLVGVAHVASNHAMHVTLLFAQQAGAWLGIALSPSRPMWQDLRAYRVYAEEADKKKRQTEAHEPQAKPNAQAKQQAQAVADKVKVVEALSPEVVTALKESVEKLPSEEGESAVPDAALHAGLAPTLHHLPSFHHQ